MEKNVRVPVPQWSSSWLEQNRFYVDIGLHVLLLAAALMPFWVLYLKRKSPVGWSDFGLLLGLGGMLLYGLEQLKFILPEYTLVFVRGYMALSFAVLAISTVMVAFRIKKRSKGAYAFRVLGTLGLLGLLIGLCLPAVPSAREAAKRMFCAGSMRRLAMLLIDSKSEGSDLLRDDGNRDLLDSGGMEVSWRVMVLPGLEHGDLYRRYDAKQSWDSELNWALAKEQVPELMCPSEPKLVSPEGGRFTSYAMLRNSNRDQNNPRLVPSKWRTGNDANKLLLVESCGANILWTEPRDVDLDTAQWVVSSTQRGEGAVPWKSKSIAASYHRNGAQAVMGDGSVRFLSSSLDPLVVEYMIRGQSFDYSEEE